MAIDIIYYFQNTCDACLRSSKDYDTSDLVVRDCPGGLLNDSTNSIYNDQQVAQTSKEQNVCIITISITNLKDYVEYRLTSAIGLRVKVGGIIFQLTISFLSGQA